MESKGLLLGARIHIFIAVLTGYISCHEGGSYLLCGHLITDRLKLSSPDFQNLSLLETGELLDGNITEKCSPDKACYSLWLEDFSETNSTDFISQGCWAGNSEQCSHYDCVNNRTQLEVKEKNRTAHMFCCCKGDYCNRNVSYVLAPAKATHYAEDTETVIIAITVMCSLAVVIVFTICFAYRMCSSTQKASPDSVCLMEPPVPTLPQFNIDDLKIAESIGRGRYGRVFRGTLYNQSVAVKIFFSQHRQNYLNERYIYCLPFMDHACLPKLIGAEERRDHDERPEYLLVLSYAPNGCLQEYLAEHTIDWPLFCKMAQCITQGLAHLHLEIIKDDKVKMCIAHRDLTSRNVIVKADGSCMLCDFGFAICISGSKYMMNGEEQVAESTSLVDVGTLRYMAPEVLEGAVNLRDCESSLKQIDVYALGLILWELATRCSDLFQGVDVPEYKVPFAAEIGNHPSMEQLQHLVVKHKARPLFPDIWKDTNPAVRALKETIEDCWDQDAEARLTALCVEERLIELPILWDRYKAGSTIQGVSPTVNPTFADIRTVQASNGWVNLSPTHWAIDSRCSGDFSMSENTAETSITMSPSESTPRSNRSSNNLKNLANNNNNNVIVSGPRVSVPLQPYQGKNPIMERNLIMEPAEEHLTISGNSLVEREGKFSTRNSSANSFSGVDAADLFNTLSGREEASESNALVPNDVLSQSTRAANPIPYVQNAVRVASAIPKQPNVPGNGHSLHVASGHGPPKPAKRGLMTGFRSLFKFPRGSTGGGETSVSADFATVPKIVEPPTVIVPKLPNTVPKPAGATNLTKVQSMDTEVYIMDPNHEFSMTQTIVRPVANRQVYSQTVPTETNTMPNGFDSENSQRKNSFQNGFIQSQTHPQLSSESSTQMKRPSTLPITILDDPRNTASSAAAANSTPVKFASGSTPFVDSDPSESEESVAMAKEANQVKSARLSLYDDRIMSANVRAYQQIQNMPCKLGSPHISASVPLSIDSLCESEVNNFESTFQHQQSESGQNDTDPQ